MPTAICNGVELHHEVHGEGTPLICVHGLGADLREWEANLPAFAARHRTVVLDNRDVGRSGYVEQPYEVEDLAADVLALADHLGIERFHLLGASLGGAIAQHVALAAPARVRTLTVAVSWAGGGRWWRARGRALWRAVPQMTPEEVVDQLLMLSLSAAAYEDDAQRSAAAERLLANPHPQRPEGFWRQARAANRHEVRERLRELTMPVHVIGAEQDVMVPVWMSRELAMLVPNAQLTIVEGAAHGLNLERAAEFNALVLRFLREA
ncbi:alpha/beta hydrolase [Patulibacter medicamentivorans]|uniref:Alpha/beta hydrolase n=1 Tax=Patulibacter medicamentivorans TaxID=1097667 RepID=H0E767_9ACTN|nr:alpha/beta fold hydrolase [Patulibacter medicamentivorans]EHN10484.1 alpha/beta hydrolase [Patulibacter medicamentivorans]